MPKNLFLTCALALVFVCPVESYAKWGQRDSWMLAGGVATTSLLAYFIYQSVNKKGKPKSSHQHEMGPGILFEPKLMKHQSLYETEKN